MRRASLIAARVAAACMAAFGCATPQRVSLECVPKNVKVYVDGRRLEASAKSVKLAKHEPHTIFVKGGGYQPQMLVFESRIQDGKPALEPVDLCSQMVFVEMQPEVKIEVAPNADPRP